ncbi:MAG: ABC transporter permease [Acidobacteriota bacterium]|nr:ABC transporter permease [Acidobacteriota bacterium]
MLRRLLHWKRTEEELDEEVRTYFEISVAREIGRGLSREEAQRLIRICFDGPEQVKHRVRQSWTGIRIQAVFQDLLYALRALKKRPGYAVIAICTLALGIGANTVIFSIVSGVLLRPLPFSHPDRLVQLNESDPMNQAGPVFYSDLQNWREQSSSFEAMIEYGNISKDIQSFGEPERIPSVWAERGLFRMLGAEPLLGRTFRENDSLRVVVLGERLWKNRFGGEQSCLGRNVLLDGESYTVIGIMPDSFQFPYRSSRTQLWIPWEVPPHNRDYRVDFVAARLRDHVPVAAAKEELGTIGKRLEVDYPETNKGRRALIIPLSEVVTGHVRPALLTLLGAVGMVLLIACANVMNLLLSCMAGRTHEIAVRSALGASRYRLIQQLLTESLVLSIAGSAAGFLVALSSLRILLSLVATHIPRSWEISLDWRVFCFLIAVSIGAGVFFGLAPALSASQIEVQNGLKDAQGSRSLGYGSSGWSGRSLRGALVIAEITMAFILLAGAGLLLKAFIQLQRTPTGLVTDRVLTLHMSIPLRDYSARGGYDRYLRQLEERIAAVPGVRAVGFIQFLPLQNSGWMGGFSIVGNAQVPHREPRAELRYVTPGYFRAFGIPLRRGRLLNPHDTSDSPPVVLINETLARRYFPTQNPIGRRTDRGTIVGIVGDVRQSGLDHPATPEIYYPFAQNWSATSDAGVSLVVSTFGQPEAVVKEVRGAIHQINPHQALFDVKTMDRVIAESISDVNLYRWLIGLFAGLALVLAIAGIYGVISYAVAARMQEFGIRLALGADSGKVFRLVLRQGSVLVASGLVLGGAGAIALTRTLRSFVPSVTSVDPVIFFLVSLLLALVAITACFVPARRAARVDPSVALRYE